MANFSPTSSTLALTTEPGAGAGAEAEAGAGAALALALAFEEVGRAEAPVRAGSKEATKTPLL
jgi:hypothetical protein